MDEKMKDNKNTNNTRRQRGYAFENHIVQMFNDISGWNAKRLGSPSIALPDVMCLNDYYKTMIAIEAKSTVQNYAYVPKDQIERCRDWVNMFGIYNSKYVVLAFKFGQTTNMVKGKLETRKLRYYYKVFPHNSFAPSQIRADYDGNIMIKENNVFIPLVMENFKI